MARKSPYITVLQVSPAYLSFVRTRVKGEDVVPESSSCERGLWQAEDGSLQEALRDFAARHRLGEDRVYTVLPRHEAALRILELPSQRDSELDGMVQLSAEDIVPFPIEELHTSYCVLERVGTGGSRVLVAVVRKAVLEAHLNVLNEAGLDPEQVFLSTACLLTELTRQGVAEGAVGALHVAPDGLEALVIRGGTMVFGRGLAADLGGAAALDAAARDEVSAELRTSLATYRRESEDGVMPGAVIVSAQAFDPGEVAAAVSGAVDVSVRPGHDGGAPSLVDLGAARSAAGDRRFFIGLLPESEVRRRAVATTRSRVVRIGALAAVAVLATIAVYGEVVYQRERYLKTLEEHAEELRPIARSLRTKRQQLEFLHEQVDRSMSPLQMLGTIVQLAPDEGLNITQFSYDRDEGITLTGSTRGLPISDGFIDRLRKEGAQSFAQFARAQELYRSARRERGQPVWDFGVSIPFSEPATDE